MESFFCDSAEFGDSKQKVGEHLHSLLKKSRMYL